MEAHAYRPQVTSSLSLNGAVPRQGREVKGGWAVIEEIIGGKAQ